MSDSTTDRRLAYTHDEVMALVSRLSGRARSIQAAARVVTDQAEAIERDMRGLILEVTRRLQDLAGSVEALQGIAPEKLGGGNGKPRPPNRDPKTPAGVAGKAG